MLASIAVNFLFGRWLERSKHRKAVLAAAVTLNLLALGDFKYAGMATGAIHRFAPAFPVTAFDLPIGISFYTFQAMSYVADVYRGECGAERSVFGFAAYISLFPQLIAGPIVRYTDVRDQLRRFDKDAGRVSEGVRLFLVGLAKKVLLANPLGLLWEGVSADPLASGTLGCWLGLVGYALQLYFDFSGYSDMARGLGAMLGFDFVKNFDYPYISKSVTEFWRRWHMTLSAWFRDYVYIPLGGSRCSRTRMCFNLLVTWMLTGLWHGAGWNFLAWGLYYGVLLVLEKLFLGKALEKLPALFRHGLTLLAVLVGWLFFASDTFGDAWRYLGVMFSVTGGAVRGGALSWAPLLLVGSVAATPLGKRVWERLQKRRGYAFWEAAAGLAAMALCTACLVSESYNPFLYFRF